MTAESRTFTVHGHGPEVTVDFYPPIELGRRPFVLGLVSFEGYNRIYNVHEDVNDKFYYGDSMLTLPAGSYTVDDIYEHIYKVLVKQFGVKAFLEGTHKFELGANNVTHRCSILASFKIDFKSQPDSIGPLLGFSARILEPNVVHESDQTVKLIEDHHVSITCNIITDVYSNQDPSHSLYDFIVTSPSGYIIRENPPVVLYHPVSVTNIRDITLRLVNRNNRLIQLDPHTPVTYKLYLQPV